MNVVWESGPVNSNQLIQICNQRYGWKKVTTYSVIRKLNERGVLKNEKATVSALIAQEQVQEFEAETLLSKAFNGSVPSFIAAFLKGKSLTEKRL